MSDKVLLFHLELRNTNTHNDRLNDVGDVVTVIGRVRGVRKRRNVSLEDKKEGNKRCSEKYSLFDLLGEFTLVNYLTIESSVVLFIFVT